MPALPGESHRKQFIPGFAAEGPWQVRVYPHLRPLYRIEGDPARTAEGIYDRMDATGAHEIVVESPDHTRNLSQMQRRADRARAGRLRLRIADLKRDARFKYVTVFKNQGRNPEKNGRIRIRR